MLKIKNWYCPVTYVTFFKITSLIFILLRWEVRRVTTDICNVSSDAGAKKQKPRLVGAVVDTNIHRVTLNNIDQLLRKGKILI